MCTRCNATAFRSPLVNKQSGRQYRLACHAVLFVGLSTLRREKDADAIPGRRKPCARSLRVMDRTMEMTLRGKCNERRIVFFPRTDVLRTNWADRGYDFEQPYTSGRYAVAVVVTATVAIEKLHLDEPALPRADVDATARCRQGSSPIGEIERGPRCQVAPRALLHSLATDDSRPRDAAGHLIHVCKAQTHPAALKSRHARAWKLAGVGSAVPCQRPVLQDTRPPIYFSWTCLKYLTTSLAVVWPIFPGWGRSRS
jgi:hypothetical protein